MTTVTGVIFQGFEKKAVRAKHVRIKDRLSLDYMREVFWISGFDHCNGRLVRLGFQDGSFIEIPRMLKIIIHRPSVNTESKRGP